ncbi:MAG: rhomboid family intramembrane serine protease, partial [Flavobacteriaceae bacterium]|nr:rhomboid family intramembrane serine protease [Flavobacteriaceae bacterium]
MSILNNLQRRYKQASTVEKLIYINLGVYLLVFVFNTFGFLFQSSSNFIMDWFTLPASFNDFIRKPWTIITYGFVHTGFIHILFNLIALYFIGNLFIEYFTSKQLITFYVLGTVFGGLIFLLSYNYFPAFAENLDRNILLGASAGVSAIFIGIATYIPNYQFKIPLIGFVKMWYIAAVWILLDVIQIPGGNAGGHLAHIGGALFGLLYV